MATKIRQSNLDNSIVTGLGELTSVANGDQTIIYDTSSGTLKKISQTNFLNFPTVSSVSPTSVTSGDGTGNYTFTITGSGFTGASASLINNSGTAVAFDTVTVNSNTQITAVIAKSSLLNSGEPYDVRVTSTNGLTGTLENQINIDASPSFVTASGSLGTQLINTAGSFSVNATDPESAGNVTFELQSGSLPPGYSITNTAAEGGTAIISGTDSTTSSTTTFNFVLRAVDAASNTSSRAFSITSRPLESVSFTSSGTFAVPTGVTSADVLVVAGGGSGGADNGGGGGAGGLVFMPGFTLTPGGTVTVTVGCGGPAVTTGSQTQASEANGGDSTFGTLTAKGGAFGRGGVNNLSGGQGGSGGGGTGHGSQGNPGSCSPGGQATQPTQPGNSGAYGFGNAGGKGRRAPGAQRAGGGGGGAGQAGSGGGCGGQGARGGDGRAYTIADGTTPVYYAGGGGGGGCVGGGQGGCGGGGPSNQAGQANKGGGAGGGDNNTAADVAGKGIVVVRY